MPESRGASALVVEEAYGWPKDKSAEAWLEQRGFGVRRIDRRLLAARRVDQASRQRVAAAMLSPSNI